MSFFGIGPLEFLLIFGVAMFIVGPKRLAEGVRSGRKYYTELKRYREELTGLVTEAIDAEDMKRQYEETKRDVWDEEATKEIKGIQTDLTLDQGELDFTGSVPKSNSTSKPRRINRGDGKVAGEDIPSMGIESGGSSPAPETGRPGA